MVVIASIAFAFFVVEITGWTRKYQLLNRKPFNCLPCLSAWVALVLYFMPEQVVAGVATMFGAGVLAPVAKWFFEWLYKILNR